MSRLGLRALLQGLLEADDQIHGLTLGASVLTLVRRFSTLQESARTMREGIQSLKEQLTAAECSIAKQGEVHREKVARLEAQLATVIAASNRAQFDLAEARERLAAQTNPATEEAVRLYIMRNMGLDSTPNESLLDLIKAVNKVHVRECASFRDDSLKAQQDAQQWRDWARPLWPEGPPNPSDAALRDAIGARMLKGIAHPLNDALAALRKVLPEGLHDEPSRARTASCMIFDAAAHMEGLRAVHASQLATTRAGWAEQSQAAAQARTEVLDLRAEVEVLRARAAFGAHLDRASAIVQQWPQWKQDVLGGIKPADKRPQPGDRVPWAEASEPGCLYLDAVTPLFLVAVWGRSMWVTGEDDKDLERTLAGTLGDASVPHGDPLGALLIARDLGSDPEQWREAMRAYLQAKGNPTP